MKNGGGTGSQQKKRRLEGVSSVGANRAYLENNEETEIEAQDAKSSHKTCAAERECLLFRI